MTRDLNMLSLDLIAPSPNSPRGAITDASLASLIESIRQNGVLQPIIVRAIGASSGPYEIVAGHRRAAAARAAGLTEIPAIIRTLDDLEAASVRMQENLQREDLTPFEEAQAYQDWLDVTGNSVQELAAKACVSVKTIRNRLALLALPPAAVEALALGTISLSIANLIASLPTETQREGATEALIDAAHDPDGLGFALARRIVYDDFMCDLTRAPFPTENGDLLPDVGACAHCPRRTGNDTDLFGEIVAGARNATDICTYPPCFKRKTEAYTEAQLEAARQKGLQVIPAKKAGKLFWEHGSLRGSVDLVDLDETCYEAPGKTKTWKAVLGDDAPPAQVAVDPRGKVRYLVPRDAARNALRKRHPSSGKAASTKRSEADRAKERFSREAHRMFVEAYVAKAESDKMRTPGAEQLRGLAALTAWNARQMEQELCCKRRNLEVKRGEYDGALLAYLETCTGRQALGLLVELLVTVHYTARGTKRPWPAQDLVLKFAETALGIDAAAIDAAAKAAVAEASAAKAKAPAKKKPARRKGAKGAKA